MNKLRDLWFAMGNISENEFQKMSKSMQKNYDAICNYLEQRMKETKE